MTDVLGDTKWLGDLLKMTVGEKCGQTQTPCFLLLQIQTCCPSLLLKLFIFHILQFTKESLWIWICLSSLLWIQCISSTWERVAFYNLGKVSPVSLYTLPHSHALRPLLLESWLDAARPSRSLQNTGFSWLVHAVLCPAFWAISSALSSIPRSPHLLIWYTSSRFLEPVCSFSLCPFLHQAPLACSAWNHFHTLTAQSLASCPGALCVWFVTTADSPSSSSIVSPSSMGTVCREKTLRAQGWGSVPTEHRSACADGWYPSHSLLSRYFSHMGRHVDHVFKVTDVTQTTFTVLVTLCETKTQYPCKSL